MTPQTSGPSDPDYLFDPAAEPDADVTAVERSLESLRFEHRSRPLTLPQRPRARWRRTALAIAASVLLLLGAGTVFWTWRQSWPSGQAWPVTLRTTQTDALNSSTLAVDRPLRLDANASADIDIARIGEMHVAPGSAVSLAETTSQRHRVVLDRGDVSVRVWAPPTRFAIRTPAGDVIDFGCMFDLSVDATGAAVLHVLTGWVQLSNFQGESLVPAGTSATMTRDQRPTVPVYDDASPEFKAAVRSFELVQDDAARTTMTAEIGRVARPRDVVTLLVLANASPDSYKRAFLERSAQLVPPPSTVTIDQIMRDRLRIWVWYDALDLPPVKSWWRNWRDAFPHARR